MAKIKTLFLKTTIVLLAFAVSFAAVPVQAMTGAVDASLQPHVNAPQGVGHRASPHLEWTNRSFGCNKWVVAGGSNTGTGTQENPWRSLKHAFAQADKGNFVCVAGGTYKENHIVPAKTGTWQEPIAFLATGEVIIVPDAGATGVDQPVFDFTNNTLPSLGYWILDGFTIDRQQRDKPGVRLEGYGANEFNVPAGPPAAVHHVIIQNLKIRNGKAGSGILVRGRVHDTLLRRNTIENFQRWMKEVEDQNHNLVFSDPQYTRASDQHFRWDAHGIAVEGIVFTQNYTPPTTLQDPSPIPNKASIKRLRIDLNTFKNNGGDGVQCLGSVPGEAAANPDSDPMDMAIINNKVTNDIANPNVFNQNVSEDGYDIKSCQFVTVGGSAAPLSTNTTPSAIRELRPTVARYDAVRNGNNSDGAGIVIHQFARNILVENNRISNACWGIKIGTQDKKVRSVLIRNNLIENNYYLQAQPGAATEDTNRCKGRGIQLTNANHVDIYNNTLANIPATAIQLADISTSDANKIPGNVDMWNNIMSHTTSSGIEPRLWVDLVSEGAAIDSNYNLFWHPGLTQAGANYSRYRIVGTVHDPRAWTAGQPESSVPSAYRASNPLFSDTINYFTQATSPARDRAFNAMGVPSCGAGLDRGYIESCF